MQLRVQFDGLTIELGGRDYHPLAQAFAGALAPAVTRWLSRYVKLEGVPSDDPVPERCSAELAIGKCALIKGHSGPHMNEHCSSSADWRDNQPGAPAAAAEA